MTCGVFEFMNTRNGKIYIGSGKDLDKIKSWLYSRLWREKHPCKSLQADFVHNRGQDFTFTVLAECTPEELKATKAKFKIAPNQYPSGLHKNRPHLTMQHRKNISFALAGEKRKPLPQATKDKISQSLLLHFEEIHIKKQKEWEITGDIYDRN